MSDEKHMTYSEGVVRGFDEAAWNIYQSLTEWVDCREVALMILETAEDFMRYQLGMELSEEIEKLRAKIRALDPKDDPNQRKMTELVPDGKGSFRWKTPEDEQNEG